MAVANGFGKVVTSGSVFMYDTGDTVNSYIGEPTVNLLYSVGATNLINGGGDIYGRCTKTDLGGGKYRFVNNGTGVSTIRLYTNQSDLINGATYGCSVYFENLILGLSIDWCDTGITGINYSTSPSGRLQGYGSRGSYASPYYFLDINLDSGGAVTLYNPQVERKDHVTPFVAGTRSATQGLLPLVGNSSLDISTVSFDSNAQMTFDGTDDFFNISTNFGTVNQYTIEYIAYLGAVNKMPIAARTNTNFYKYGDNSWRYVHGGVGDEFYHEISPAISGYIHCVVTYDGSLVRVWRNGYYAGSKASAGTADFSDGFKVGYWAGGGSYAWNGPIPIVKIYNRALPAAEVQQNYNKYKTRFNLS